MQSAFKARLVNCNRNRNFPPRGFARHFNASFRKQVRDLVAANGDLKLGFRRARAEILVLNTERKGLEERFLLRTPSPPATPPVGDIATKSVTNDGSVHEADWVQREGNNKSGGEVETAGNISCAGTNLHHAILTGGGDHAGSENRLTLAAGNLQVDRAINPGLKLGDDVAMAGESDDDRLKATGVVASGMGVEVSGHHGKDAPGFESSSRSESDMDCWASNNRDVYSRSARSSEREVFDSCDSASSECDAREKPAELNDGASCGELASTVQAAGGTFDKALELNVGRSGKRRVFSTRSLPSQLLGACFGSDKGVASMGRSGTRAEPTHPRSTSLPGSFLVARDSGHNEAQSRTYRTDTPTPGSQLERTALVKYDGVADDGPSICKVKDGPWPSASFIAARADAEDMSGVDDEGGAQVMVNFLPLDKASSAGKRPRVRRRPRANKDQNIINYFLNENRQSSSDSCSPGG